MERGSVGAMGSPKLTPYPKAEAARWDCISFSDYIENDGSQVPRKDISGLENQTEAFEKIFASKGLKGFNITASFLK